MVRFICILLGLQLADGHGKPLFNPFFGRQCLYSGQASQDALSLARSATVLRLAPQDPLLVQHIIVYHGAYTLLHHPLGQYLAMAFSGINGRADSKRFYYEVEVPTEISQGSLLSSYPASGIFLSIIRDVEGSLRISLASSLVRFESNTG
jgi:hypothetical protein